MSAVSVHVLLGDDESILRAGVNSLVQTLVGDGDRALMVDEFDAEDYTVGAVVDAAYTAPFLTERRIVVGRATGPVHRRRAGGARRLPVRTAAVYRAGDRVGESAATEASRRGAADGGGDDHVDIAAEPARGSRRVGPGRRQGGRECASARAAVERIVGHLGENVGSLDGVLRTLSATFGGGRVLGPEQVDPFLGDAGGVPPWDLTDAIDGGRTSAPWSCSGGCSAPVSVIRSR